MTVSLHSNQKHGQITIEITIVNLKDFQISVFFIDLSGLLMILIFLGQIKTFYPLENHFLPQLRIMVFLILIVFITMKILIKLKFFQKKNFCQVL